MATIQESYRDYTPPHWIRPSVERLLSTVPAGHLSGVEAIVLTDSAAIGKDRTLRVRGRRFDRRSCRGFYHPRHGSTPAWIDLVVDNILAVWPRPLLAFGFFRDLIVADVLFHEIGHHLDATVGAAA